MGVFAWFRRGQAAESTEAAATAAVADRPEPQQEATSAGQPRSACPAEGEEEATAAGGAADPVGIPKQQSADGAADSESGEGARA